jgi:hypothetical protein
MAEQINLNKVVYSKTQYERVIDTSFTQLVETTPVSPTVIPSISTAEFFQNYQEIFYQIPKFGDTNSHEYLIKTSQAYLGSSQINDETIQALIDEVTILRAENLDLQQQIINLQVTGNI